MLFTISVYILWWGGGRRLFISQEFASSTRTFSQYEYEGHSSHLLDKIAVHGRGSREAAYLFWAVTEVQRQVWAPNAICKVFGLPYLQEKKYFYKF